MVAATKDFVSNLITLSDIAHNNLLAFSDHDTINSSSVMSSARTTPAESLYLKSIHSVGELYESRGSWKELGPEIGEDSKGIDIDSKPIDNFCKPVDLIRLIELSFVADDVIDAIAHR